MPKTIPTFKNLKEEAVFWDTHDIGDFMGELNIVEGSYKSTDEKKTTMTIRLTPSLKRKLDKISKGYDISTSSLVRMWVVDKVRKFAS
ncbi:MAG: hypothetical protein COU69_04060 [Candidatus Pacebacteria bacterium CG10_big_fil_rev_8_21_14_0_10_56_10]|nr:MAG: hypothetical protein COU69_04060 [Candidatus Pacebacteria bacterium CG10_big_fil_rev_8_21_14_0_10_56_10]